MTIQSETSQITLCLAIGGKPSCNFHSIINYENEGWLYNAQPHLMPFDENNFVPITVCVIEFLV